MLNKIVLQGRMVNDVEGRTTTSGDMVLTFTIACDRDYKDESGRKSDFFDVVAWRGLADFISKYFHKGDMLLIEGRLQQRTYQGQDGQPRKKLEIVADKAYFSGPKQRDGRTEQEDFSEGDYTDIFGE